MYNGHWDVGYFRRFRRFGYIQTASKCNNKPIGISFSVWGPNGDKFMLLASSGSRDLENLFSP